MTERMIQKLEPPPDAKHKLKEMDKKNLPTNPIMRFIKIFFLGDGYGI